MKENKSADRSNWTMSLPVPVEFGTGCIQKINKYLSGISRALVVTGRHAMKSAGVTEKICNILRDSGVETRIYDRVSSEPDYREMEEAGTLAREFNADMVIGCGGGSAMDAAKAAAVAATHSGSIMDYQARGPREITKITLPIIAISTTSGTGSHVGRVAVLSDRERKIKRALFSDYLYPRAAICDSEVLSTMSSEITAISGFDAFAHALEGYLSSSENPMGNLCAQEAIRIIFHTLPDVIEHGSDLALRSRMAWADTLAGVSLATNAIVIPHAIGMVLGGRYGIKHGCAVASVMVSCLRHSRDGAIGKLVNVARLCGYRESLTDDKLADWAIDAIERFIVSIGLGKSITEYRVPQEDFDKIAAEARDVFSTRVDADPVPTDVTGLTRVLHHSAGFGRTYIKNSKII